MSNSTTRRESPTMEARMSKRPRYMSSWECSFHNRDNSGTRFGLVDLFGSRKRRRHLKSQEQQGESSSSACHIRTNTSTDNNEDFFTFRMEHREGGAISQHYGEERILIFKSDRPGAIAKIIYSSSPAENEDSAEEEADASGETTDIDNERELDMMAQAKVHVLSVKEDYRGYDLGGLLFSEAMASLRHRYCDDRRKSTGIQPHYSHMSSVRCQLDAEEDIRRHDKLIGFYEQLGCSVKPKAKITYLNNNDGNTYRKIPMQVALKARPEKLKDSVATSLMDRKQGFLPVVLLEAPGKRVGVPSSSSRSNPAAARVDWLVVETGEGLLEFHTTKGAILFVKPDGQYYTASEDDETSCSHEDNNCSKFLLLRVSDARQRVLQGEVDADSDDDYSSTSIEARQKELWMIQSTRGSFLNFDPVSHSLTGSLQPSFWQANDHTLSLTCTCDTPPRRQHYRRMWAKQTVTYVNTMRERYLGFNLEHMSLKKALDLAHTLPANPYSMEPGVSTPSLRTLCYRTAEIARGAGHPDWVQFIALIHALGSVINCVDSQTAAESDDDYDWTICTRSRIVGCATPTGTSFSEFQGLNIDEGDKHYASAQGVYAPHGGLEQVKLTWTGPEYMYHMLKHNNIDIPEEGFSILRFFSLHDWHTREAYAILANENDIDVQPFVADFDEMRRFARKSLCKENEMNNEESDTLWNTHYSHIMSKYGADGLLKW